MNIKDYSKPAITGLLNAVGIVFLVFACKQTDFWFSVVLMAAGSIILAISNSVLGVAALAIWLWTKK